MYIAAGFAMLVVTHASHIAVLASLTLYHQLQQYKIFKCYIHVNTVTD